ncbi:MAG: MBL fold metallo-hydrolase [Terriglobia bacterium]
MGILRLTFLGTGTSMGVPTLGCGCRVCHSDDPHDRRTRPSLLLQYNGRAVVIDTSPDFRFQAFRSCLDRLDAVLYTHAHADHILGLDDVRPFNMKQRQAIPLYATRETLAALRRTFFYIFDHPTPASTVPEVELKEITGPFDLFGQAFQPVPALHGTVEVLGFRFGPAAYLTDFSRIEASSRALLGGLDLLVLDALREEPHPMHSSLSESLALVRELKPRRAYFTHICHDLAHAATNARLPAGVELAYDTLAVELEV